MREGMRVRLVGFDEKRPNVTHALWLAGKVPFGATGTLYRDDRGMMCVRWDRPGLIRKKQAGYVFGLSTGEALPAFLEEIRDAEKPLKSSGGLRAFAAHMKGG